MGYEGSGASIYWSALRESNLVQECFTKRQGRGALDITNQLLNYGYTMLTGYIWSALDNAGFELYAGLLHSQRAGKPSLVLDMMEEYRSWVVDRNVIKLRSQLRPHSMLDAKLKRKLSTAIHSTMGRRLQYRGRKLKLESISEILLKLKK